MAVVEPTLVVVCGLPGVGKTTVAETVSDRLGADLYRTDVVRKELFPSPEYTSEETDRVYTELIERGVTTATEAGVAVLDGTFRATEFRDQLVETAADRDLPVRFVKVECDEDIVETRIRNRTDDPSDAEFEDHLYFRQIFEPLERDHVTIDNSETLAETRRQVDSHFEVAELSS